MYNNVIAVNIGKSINTRKSVKEAAQGYWRPIGVATSSELLEKAEIVLAVRVNIIKGIFTTQSVTQDPADLRYEWELVDAPALHGLIGHRVPENGPYWKPGDLAGWKSFDPTLFEGMVEIAKRDVIRLGPHSILLMPDGSLEIGLAPGHELHVTSLGAQAGVRDRIAAVVNRLGESRACTTYTAIAQMLSLGSTQAVNRSIVKNAAIPAEEAARVLPLTYSHNGDWVVPVDDADWGRRDGDSRDRAGILVDLGLAEMNPDGTAALPGHTIITDGATLRRYLNV